MLVLLTLLITAIVCYSFYREGLLTACCMLVNVLLAGIVSFSTWEFLANALEPALAGSPVAGFEDCLCLVLVFSLVLGILRGATNSLANAMPDYHPVLMQGGVVLVGVLTGYLVSGFLVVAMQTLPLPRDFLGFDSSISETQLKGVRRFLPADRVWLAMMHRISEGPLAWGERPGFDPNGNFSLRYTRYRRTNDKGATQPVDGALSPR